MAEPSRQMKDLLHWTTILLNDGARPKVIVRKEPPEFWDTKNRTSRYSAMRQSPAL